MCVRTDTQPRTTRPRLEAPAVQAATQYTEPCRLPGRIRGRTKLPENLRRSSIRYALFGVAHESRRDAGLEETNRQATVTVSDTLLDTTKADRRKYLFFFSYHLIASRDSIKTIDQLCRISLFTTWHIDSVLLLRFGPIVPIVSRFL